MAESRRREILPPELAALVDLAERPRVEQWSLRAALTRYAQPEPVRVSNLLHVVRRLEFGLAASTDALRSRGPELWAALAAGESAGDSPDGLDGVEDTELVLGLLRCAREVDELGDALARWAARRDGEHPDAEVDRVTTSVADRLDAIGAPVDDREPPPGVRRRG